MGIGKRNYRKQAFTLTARVGLPSPPLTTNSFAYPAPSLSPDANKKALETYAKRLEAKADINKQTAELVMLSATVRIAQTILTLRSRSIPTLVRFYSGLRKTGSR